MINRERFIPFRKEILTSKEIENYNESLQDEIKSIRGILEEMFKAEEEKKKFSRFDYIAKLEDILETKSKKERIFLLNFALAEAEKKTGEEIK